MPGVDRLGQTGELHAVADEVRPHRQHDVDRHARAARAASSSSLTKAIGFVAGVRDLVAAAEPEQLLELIDEHEDVVVGRQCAPAGRRSTRPRVLRRSVASSSTRLVARRALRRAARRATPRRRSAPPRGCRSGSSPGRMTAMRQLEPAPAMMPLCSDGNQSRADERRLAAARRADDRAGSAWMRRRRSRSSISVSRPKNRWSSSGLERPKTGKGVKQSPPGLQPAR